MSEPLEARNWAKISAGIRADIGRPPVPFTNPALIATNQQGHLTPEQISMVASSLYAPASGCWLSMVPGILLLLIVGWFILQVLQGQVPTTPTFYLVSLGLLALVAVGLVWHRRANGKRATLQQSAAAGYAPLLDQAPGEITWDQQEKRYRLHVPHHPALAFPVAIGHSATSERLTDYLRPGPYQFYFVKDWGKKGEILVSAQPIRTPTQMLSLPEELSETALPGDELARLVVQQALCSVLDFSLVHLEANRRGTLTPGQISTLPGKIARQGDLVARQVTGEIQVRQEQQTSFGSDGTPESERTDYFYELGGHRFPVPEAAVIALGGPGIHYHIYYLERPLSLLSLEPLAFRR